MKQFSIIAVALLVIILSACSLNYENTGSVSVSTAGETGSRTVMPDEYVKANYFRAKLLSSAKNEIGSADFGNAEGTENSASFDNIPFGTYTVDVYGYSDASRLNVLSKGSAEVNVTSSGTNSVTVILTPIAQPSIDDTNLTGTISITMSFADSMQISRIKLVNASGEIIATQEVEDNAKTVEFCQKIPAGLDQALHFEFFLGTQEKEEFIGRSVEEIYNIYSGQVAKSTQNTIDESDPYHQMFFPEARSLTKFEVPAPSKLNSLSAVFTVPDYAFDSIELSIGQNSSSEIKTFSYEELTSYSGSDFTHEFTTLGDSTEYEVTARIKHTTGQYSPSIIRTQKTATPLESISIIYDADAISNLSPNDEYQFTLKTNPVDASDFGGEWKVSNTAISSISKDGLLTITGVGETTVSYNAKNNSQSASVKISIRLERPVVSAIRSDDGNSIVLTWNDCGIADSYEVYRSVNSIEEEAPIATLGTSVVTYTDSDLVAGNTYSYKVIARHTASENYSESGWTSLISTEKPTIVIEQEDGRFDLDNIMAGIKQNQVFTTDRNLIIEVRDLSDQGVIKYEWYLNGFLVSEGRQVTITKDTAGLNDTQHIAFQSLMLKVYDESGYTYSGSLNLFYVDDLTNLPDYDVLTFSTDSGKTRFSSRTADDSLRTVQLVATAENNLNYFTYSITSGNDIATIDSETGIVTFTDEAFGNVEVTASPKYAAGESKSITLDVYRATVTSVTQLINSVNDIWNQELGAAEASYSKNDWWGSWASIFPNGDAQTSNGTGIGFTIVNESGGNTTPPGNAYTSIDSGMNKIQLEGIGQVSLKSQTNISMQGVDGGEAGYLSVDYLGKIGINNGGGKLDIMLPFNQGTATITYHSIVVRNDDGPARGGSYDVAFEEDILGLEGTDLSQLNIIDSDNSGIRKMYYR